MTMVSTKLVSENATWSSSRRIRGASAAAGSLLMVCRMAIMRRISYASSLAAVRPPLATSIAGRDSRRTDHGHPAHIDDGPGRAERSPRAHAGLDDGVAAHAAAGQAHACPAVPELQRG